MEKVSAVYKIVNKVTGDFYIGSSKDVKLRWANHKCPSMCKKYPNNKLYQDMQKYGVDKFIFQILTPVMPEYLKQVEQEFIEMLHPTYNKCNAKGIDFEKEKEYKIKYRESEKGKKTNRECNRKYFNQKCVYNGEIMTLAALSERFYKAGIEHPVLEAKKYLEKNNNEEEE